MYLRSFIQKFTTNNKILLELFLRAFKWLIFPHNLIYLFIPICSYNESAEKAQIITCCWCTKKTANTQNSLSQYIKLIRTNLWMHNFKARVYRYMKIHFMVILPTYTLINFNVNKTFFPFI